MKPYNRGFIALVSSVLISAILMSLAFTVGGSSLFARFDTLGSEYKRIALSLAESCQNQALLNIAQNYSYTPGAGGDTISVDAAASPWPESCIIKSVVYGAENASHQKVATITTTGQYPPQNGAHSSLKVAAVVQNPFFAVPGRGSLRVIVNIVNDDGGTKQPGYFTIAVSAANPFPASFSGAGGSGVLVMMDAGSYAVSITNQPSDYTSTASAQCSGSIAAGATQTCTITENDIPTTASLTLTAKVINDNGGTKLPSDFSLTLNGNPVASGVPNIGLAPGSYTAGAGSAPPGYTISSPAWGTDCSGAGNITLAAGNKKTCTVTYDDIPPPSPVCADSVMILDRTGSLFSANANDDEAAAAIALVNLYDTVTPDPKLGVGSIGAYPNASLPAGAASVPTSGQLSTAYTTIKNLITSMMNNSSSVGSNLAAGINAGNTELNNTTRHGVGKQKVLIFVSDGNPDSPSSSTVGNTGFLTPTSASANGASDFWSNPAGAYSAGQADDSAGHRERYSNLGLTVPAAATITNIELQVLASSSPFTTTTNLFTDGFGTGSTDSSFNESPAWTEGGSGAEKRAIGAGNDTASADGGRFAAIFDTGWICEQINAAGYTGLKLGYYWRGDVDANSASDLGIVEYRTGGSCSSSSGWTTFQSQDLRNDTAWSTQSASALPSSLNNSTFFMRFRASSNSNEYFRVDAVSITGQTTTTCTLGTDLSWDGGASWTSELTQPLTTSNVTYTLSGWGGHSWVPGDFADSKFRIRIHDTNPGAMCHVDTLSARVSYNTTVSPAEAALNAADAAKLQGDPADPTNKTQIFSIFFGSDPDGTGPLGRELMAKLASGLTAIAGHQNGSAFDQSSTPQVSNTSLRASTAAMTPTQWSAPDNVFVSDNTYATDSTSGHQQGYGSFGVSIPAGATVSGIEVNTEAKSSDSSGCQIGGQVSWNGGTIWSGQKTVNVGGSDSGLTLGSTNDTWGHTWLGSETIDGKFMVRLQNVHTGSCSGSAILSVDQVRVRITYSYIPENGDGDNFFVSPTSAEMPNIFTTIGAKVCPAAVAPPPAPPPTKGTLIVLTHLINDNGGSNVAADFTMNVLTGLNPSMSSFPGSDAPGVAITLDPGAYSIDQSASPLLYAKTLGPACSGNILAGDVLTCTIVDDDIPPPPVTTLTAPPAPTSVNINAWQETP